MLACWRAQLKGLALDPWPKLPLCVIVLCVVFTQSIQYQSSTFVAFSLVFTLTHHRHILVLQRHRIGSNHSGSGEYLTKKSTIKSVDDGSVGTRRCKNKKLFIVKRMPAIHHRGGSLQVSGDKITQKAFHSDIDYGTYHSYNQAIKRKLAISAISPGRQLLFTETHTLQTAGTHFSLPYCCLECCGAIPSLPPTPKQTTAARTLPQMLYVATEAKQRG